MEEQIDEVVVENSELKVDNPKTLKELLKETQTRIRDAGMVNTYLPSRRARLRQLHMNLNDIYSTK